MGGPKALVELRGEPLVRRALRVLAAGGCAPLVVVLGAAAAQARLHVPPNVRVVQAHDWMTGMGASLRAGLEALAADEPGCRASAALVHLVDLPGVTSAAIARLVADAGPTTLRRAAYAGVPGHPVLLGRAHWRPAGERARGDAGARAYLAGNPVLQLIECGDIAFPDDVDTPEQLRELGT